MAAEQAGLVKGYEDGTFRPNASITRQELVAVVVRAMQVQGLVQEDASQEDMKKYLTFKDSNQIDDWAKTAVVTAVRNKIISGFPGNLLKPKDLTNRTEAAVFIYRMLSV